jgi:hypothetical protein
VARFEHERRTNWPNRKKYMDPAVMVGFWTVAYYSWFTSRKGSG